MEILSFPSSSHWSWVIKKILKAQYLVQEQEDTFKLDQNFALCFLLKYKWATFIFPGSYLLGSKGLPPYTKTTVFFKVLFFPWPAPEDRSQHGLARSAGYFLEDTESLLPIAHLSEGIQVTRQKQSSMSDIWKSFVNVKGVKHVKVHPAEFIRSFNKCLFSVYCVPGPGLGPRHTMTTAAEELTLVNVYHLPGTH